MIFFENETGKLKKSISANVVHWCYFIYIWTSWCLDDCFRGKLSPPPEQLPPGWLPASSWLLDTRQLPQRIIAPEENCPPGKCPRGKLLRIIAPGKLINNCPRTIFPWKLAPRKIAFPMICCLHKRVFIWHFLLMDFPF